MCVKWPMSELTYQANDLAFTSVYFTTVASFPFFFRLKIELKQYILQ